ncbi:MAG: hemolysin III family protein [Akkermansiaceae bacterium]|jgi:hemolysin III|nr:hemolysin III family protein [Akkermansiaceae bacterium]MBJ7425279.1 hemolysin III family protein [Akkermansiaceae bacterium]
MSLEIPQRSPLCDSHREEVASLATHAAGVVFSIASMVTMLFLSWGTPMKVFSAAIFGTSLVLLYTSSTLYHFSTSPRWKAHFQSLDHACIYLLIAGSYTPITLVTLRGAVGGWLFGIVWSLAICGVLIKTMRKGKKDHWISTLLYLAMGWIIIFAFGPLLQRLSPPGVWWLVAGGCTYSLGIIFYAWNRLPFNHAIWHLFVLGGSACHVWAISCYVLQQKI